MSLEFVKHIYLIQKMLPFLYKSGPLSELHFWSAKSSNLSNILDQLENKKMKEVLKVIYRHQ